MPVAPASRRSVFAFLFACLGALPLVNCGSSGGPTLTGPGPTPANCGCQTSMITGGGVATGTSMTAGELAMADDVLGIVNAERAQRGLSTLEWDTQVAQVAYDHCIYQEGISTITHDGPGACVTNLPTTDCLLQRLIAGGIGQFTISLWGENVARGQQTPDEVMCGTFSWMLSAGHCANILEPTYTHVGIAVRVGAAEGPYWTQVFIRRP